MTTACAFCATPTEFPHDVHEDDCTRDDRCRCDIAACDDCCPDCSPTAASPSAGEAGGSVAGTVDAVASRTRAVASRAGDTFATTRGD